MRFIKKAAEPDALRQWKKDNAASTQNLSYGNLPGAERDKVKASLLKEQGYICAYTMQRLAGNSDCHIEHIQPQNVAPGLDLDYLNMAACFPSSGGNTSHGFGAPVKAGEPVTLNVDFISPHVAGCEAHFSFSAMGGISADPTDAAGSKTIDLLQLNHSTLIDLRRRALEAHGLTLRPGTTRKPRRLKSAAEARRLAAEVLQPGTDGCLEPFCIALAQVALEFADKEEARSRRMRTQHGERH